MLTTNDQVSDPKKTSSVWASSWFVLSCVVVGLLGLLLVYLLLANSDTQQAPAKADAAVGEGADRQTQDQDQKDESSPSVCGLNDVQLTGGLTQAPEAQWTLVGAIAAPQAPGVGPGVVQDNGFRFCYARTPKGAVFAAANQLALMGNDDLLQQNFEQLILPGTGRDAGLEQIRKDSHRPTGGM